jgi:sulfite reductase beta subunit-like hemoprotein
MRRTNFHLIDRRFLQLSLVRLRMPRLHAGVRRMFASRSRKGGMSFRLPVAAPLGDIGADPLRAVSEIARRYASGRARISIGQNLILRWVPEEALPHVFHALRKLGMALAESDQITDITRCPGADTCQLALTHSRALASALQDALQDRYRGIPEVTKLSIKISGCMNSCGQHHIADVGLFGSTIESAGKVLPVYTLMLGGRTTEGRATFGKIVGKIPARMAPDAVRAVLDFYAESRQFDEEFFEFLDRVGTSGFRQLLAPFTDVSDYGRRHDLQFDLGEVHTFKAEIGVGECAS